jgi:hypothetical protein
MSDTSPTSTTTDTAIATDGGGVDTSVTSPTADTSPATTPGIFGEGMTFREGWFNDVKDSSLDPYRSMAAQFKDLPSMLKSMHDTKAALSQRTEGMVRIPGKDATPDEISAYHRAIGVPESPDKYQIQPPTQLPEGVEFRPEALTQFAEFAHKAGIPNEVANQLIAFQAQVESAEVTRLKSEHDAAVQAQEKQLQQEWGGQWEQKNMLAKRAADTVGLGADHPALANADIRKAMARVADLISEDKLSGHDKVSGVLSPGNEAKDILSNPDNPLHKAYHDSTHPNNKHARSVYMQKMEEQVRMERR